MNRLADKLERMEELESEVWVLTAAKEGRSAQSRRMSKWNEWIGRQQEKIAKIRDRAWELDRSRDRGGSDGSCRHSRGHLEKVKLPMFSGKQEEFSEFRNQFRELCRGEQYTPILEMAQLKMKLPREALTMIAGIQCPDAAWTKLEELYGNRELSIMSALKNLRDFKSSKQASHEQVIEIAMAVQKCRTELDNIGAIKELLGDREALACVVQSLPTTVRDKWYDKKIPEETAEKGQFLLTWLEEQRENAIRLRLDMMAARMRGGAAATSTPKSGPAHETTDKGLVSSALHASKSAEPAAAKALAKPGADKTPVGGTSGPSTRVEVRTAQDAEAIAARRKASLEAKKMDKCPVCSAQHSYERTWNEVQPPVKAKLVSTHLTSCPKFLALPAEAKLAAVVGNAACLQCAAWDHSEHKYPGRRESKEPKCSVLISGAACGGRHGRWYHEGTGSGAAHSVVAAAASQGPGLYEVYHVPVHLPAGEAEPRSEEGMVMIDPGADTNFIRNDFARRLNLAGEPCQFRLKVVDQEARSLSTARYYFEVEAKDGSRHVVVALGLDTITILPPDPDLSDIKSLVCDYPPEVLSRPQGDVDLLLGLGNSALHGVTVEQWGNLRLLKSPLGCGWSLRGTHPSLQQGPPRIAPSLSATAYALQQSEADSGEELRVFHMRSLQEFQELDELGTTPHPVCLKCQGCRDCTFRRKRLTAEEQAVVTRVEQEMRVDNVTGTITASYPWKNCVKRMLDNRRQASRVQETMERHMLAVGTHGDYVKEMTKSHR